MTRDNIQHFSNWLEFLNGITDNAPEGKLISINGRPAMGKTALMNNAALAFAAEYNITSAIFSLEMSDKQIINRIISIISGLPSEVIKSDCIAESEQALLDNVWHSFKTLPLYIDDTLKLSLYDFKQKCSKLTHEDRLKIVFIDYLGLMDDVKHAKDYAMLMKELKEFASKTGITIFVLEQVTRAELEKLDSLNGKFITSCSKPIEVLRFLDAIIHIHRPEYYAPMGCSSNEHLWGYTELHIRKVASTSDFIVPLLFNHETTSLEFLSQEDYRQL